MHTYRWMAGVVAMLMLLAPGVGRATDAPPPVSVSVTDSWPQGDDLTLGPNQNFYLRLAYRSAAPVDLAIHPYFHGETVKVGISPPARYRGEGEALVWISSLAPGDEVDEIRITAGDESAGDASVAATYPVHLTGVSQAAAGVQTPPDWVQQLLRDREAKSAPASAGTLAFFSVFMLAMFAIGLLGLAAPAWALWRWRGIWRVLAAIPAAVMAWTVLDIFIGVARDATSHNLWPFEILLYGGFSAISVAVMALFRRVFRPEA